MLTPNDIENAARKSGFDHVNANGPASWRAASGGKPRFHGDVTRLWRGPTRATPLQAAQDYCDYINGNPAAAAVALKSAGNNGKRDSLPMNEEVQEALGILRDARAARKGKQGYVYLIVETQPGGAEHYAKIGFSTNPLARVGELQTGNPRPLRLAGQIKGTEADESRLHAKYIKHNSLQEWFWLTDDIRTEFGVPTADVARVAA